MKTINSNGKKIIKMLKNNKGWKRILNRRNTNNII